MKILALIILSIMAVWLESFFMAGLGAPDTVYFSAILVVMLLLAQKPNLALAAAITSGLAADLMSAQTAFGVMLAGQTATYAVARKTLNGLRTTHPAAEFLLAAAILAGYGFFRQLEPRFLWFLSGSEVKPPFLFQSALAAALFTCLFFCATLSLTGAVSRLAKKWFL